MGETLRRIALGIFQSALGTDEDCWQPCPCQYFHPCRSGGMSVLVGDAAESVMAAYVQSRDLVRVGDRFGWRVERPGVRDALVPALAVVETFELAQGVQQVRLVPDQGPVQQLTAARQDPTLHDRIQRLHG
jgi:hypothetical protein